ncbi:MAG: dihydrolipoyl dehydrogenase [Firmicutes bacterium]|nr:dihydrolipoyl dehydrogenase [Bacillota bacterium]HXL03438.1 dihydrolipoyl dehydrogenase [Bacillota bacterium]
MFECDVLVLGGGPGGYVAAIRAAQLGKSVCLIEKDQLGGTCLNRGCIPTKSLIACMEAFQLAQRLGEFGVEAKDVSVDFGKMIARKNRIVSRLRAGVGFLLKKGKVKVVTGTGRLVAPGRIAVDSEEGSSEIKAESIIIATGSRPLVFPSFNYNGSSVITSDEALDFREVPESLLVVGGGVIGCELAFIFAGLGSKVTVVDIMPTVLPMEDPDVSSAILASLKKHGIDVMCGVKIESITEGDREVTALLDSGRQLVAEKALLSVGRRANSEGIGLEELGVELNKRGEIAVDEDMETNVRGIYAIGDVVGNIMLAHVASHEGIVAAHNVAGDKKSMDYNAVPSAIFTRPEVASVGLNEVQAKEQGFDVRIGKFPFMASGKALAMGRTEGFVKVIADAESDVILGVHIVGPGATDLIPEPTVAVRTQMTVHEFTNTIHAHPTLAEALVEAAQAVHGMSIHI